MHTRIEANAENKRALAQRTNHKTFVVCFNLDQAAHCHPNLTCLAQNNQRYHTPDESSLKAAAAHFHTCVFSSEAHVHVLSCY